MKLTNFTEQVVFECIDEVISNYDVCSCDRCKLDIAALALNKLKPHYYVTHKGQVYTKLRSYHVQEQADVYSAVAKAIEVVSAKPRHVRE